ncbi:unnamed protein product [Penicillium nalgiovense]|nr:unnamed protein product [Penicillium nalgiovense]
MVKAILFTQTKPNQLNRSYQSSFTRSYSGHLTSNSNPNDPSQSQPTIPTQPQPTSFPRRRSPASSNWPQWPQDYQ